MQIFQKIYKWYADNKRVLPWRETDDPYKIWLSEIILQQTRVEQGKAYYVKFISNFPTVFDLANASEDEVLKLWQGLGYYTRARNLHKAAQYIVNECNGKMPNNYSDLLKLPGVGDYTASAISSIAYGEQHAVVDGNVFRVLSRIFGVMTPIDTTEGRKDFKMMATKYLDKQNSGLHNEAIMEFGAIQCKQGMPNCSICPVIEYCYAFNNSAQLQLPVKSKKIKKRSRYFFYLYISYQNTTYLEKREKSDIWKGLYQLPLIEIDSNIKDDEIERYITNLINTDDFKIRYVSENQKHILTHQTIYAKLIKIEIEQPISKKCNFIAIDQEELVKFAIPKLVENLLIDAEIL